MEQRSGTRAVFSTTASSNSSFTVPTTAFGAAAMIDTDPYGQYGLYGTFVRGGRSLLVFSLGITSCCQKTISDFS